MGGAREARVDGSDRDHICLIITQNKLVDKTETYPAKLKEGLFSILLYNIVVRKSRTKGENMIKYKDKTQEQKDRIKAQRKQYYIENKESIKKKHKEWGSSHKQQISDTHKKYYLENRDEIKSKRKKIYCINKEASCLASKKWRQKRKTEHPELWKAWRDLERLKAKARNRKRIEEYKALNPCIVCGETNPAALVFHHRNPNEKKDNVSHLSKVSSSWRQVEIEIGKCEILCANCHLIVHDQIQQCEKNNTQFSLDGFIKAKKEQDIIPTPSLPLAVASTGLPPIP